ncbi:MAG: SprT family zinc-dependent metalloprotease [Clostridiales bacterium]|nr:SprT family zinc-dependent metalloprotease [Clostridiales bacterium]
MHVKNDAKVEVRAPLKMSNAAIMKFVNQKSDWINKKVDQVLKGAMLAESARNSFDSSDGLLFLGEKIDPAIVQKTRMFQDTSMGSEISPFLLKWYKKEARRIISERVVHFSGITGISYKSIGITSARHRWGSCGHMGTLNFSWRLVRAPLEVVDYVVVHELAHVKVKNHSREFWAVVRAILPGYASKRKWLKTNRWILDI